MFVLKLGMYMLNSNCMFYKEKHMFLNKRAEEAFINFVKQAKEAMTGENQDYSEIVSKITAGAINEVVPQVAAMKPEDRDKFYGSAEFRELTDANQNAFKKAVEDANNTMNAVKEAKKDRVVEKGPEGKESADLNAVPTAGNKDNQPEGTADDTTGGNLLDNLLKKDEAPNTEEEISKGASLFDLITKKAEESEITADIRKIAPGKIEQVIAASVNAQCVDNPDADKDTVVNNAIREAGVGENYKNVAEAVYNKCVARKTQTIDNITEKTASLLEQINNYTPEPNKYEKILTIAKSCANSSEFFQKCAAELDSKENTQQYKGKEMFDGKYTTFGGADTPKFPGQKVFMGRDGGNPAVETIFKATMKPEVDVYNDKKNRKKVTTIKSQDGIIAFIQPIADDEPEKIGVGFDYNGIVTGEIQKKPEGVGEPKATAAHTTEKYLDKINELADKKPEQLSGKLPSSKAAMNSDLKKKAEAEYASIGEINVNVGTIQNDSMDGTTTKETTNPGNKTLSAEESAEAIKKVKEREAQLQRASSSSSFIFHVKASDTDTPEQQQEQQQQEYEALISLLEQLKKDVPAAYNAVARAANNTNDDYFRTVIHKALTTNLPTQLDEIKTILPNVPLEEVRSKYFKIAVPEEKPQQDPSSEENPGKDKDNASGEKNQEKGNEAGGNMGSELADILGGN